MDVCPLLSPGCPPLPAPTAPSGGLQKLSGTSCLSSAVLRSPSVSVGLCSPGTLCPLAPVQRNLPASVRRTGSRGAGAGPVPSRWILLNGPELCLRGRGSLCGEPGQGDGTLLPSSVRLHSAELILHWATVGPFYWVLMSCGPENWTGQFAKLCLDRSSSGKSSAAGLLDWLSVR